MTALIVFAHGSSVESANESVRALARRVRETAGYFLTEPAFLELGSPDLPQAVGQAVSSGATRIVVVPYFLTLGMHLTRDLPRIIDRLRHIYEGVPIEVTEPLDGHPALAAIVLDRARKAIDGGRCSESPAD